ncbi:hypothetical protein DSJ_19785 [Pantoea stewartii subsp. stewartii DC283]|uniref:Uncharacterized protein n=1 Tax=Pantoea stewartii subsp. stewartii DC283 TaxID=660596 RepID=A0ABN4Z909_PANSE|nr:hypothetical protein DSJ_19785 [Pantoea stewartii subsp. stewartii DC283]
MQRDIPLCRHVCRLSVDIASGSHGRTATTGDFRALLAHGFTDNGFFVAPFAVTGTGSVGIQVDIPARFQRSIAGGSDGGGLTVDVLTRRKAETTAAADSRAIQSGGMGFLVAISAVLAVGSTAEGLC